jgi:hypothetical protein
MGAPSRLGVFALCAGILAAGFAVTLTQFYKAKSADSSKLEDAFVAKASRVRSWRLIMWCPYPHCEAFFVRFRTLVGRR